MPRKKREAKTDITPALLKFREKRKWQIALRRYVLERNMCIQYAPYFGLDIENMRKWFEMQFETDIGWRDFAKEWQFDHIIPVTYFDFSIEEDLKLCWNFTNLRVELFQGEKDKGNRLDILAAKGYFEKLFKATNYPPCLKMLQKINQIELSELLSSEKQQQFIRENRAYLEIIENYSHFEFELLNHGRSVEDVNKEAAFFKKFDKLPG
jgi:hypothetical protein